MPVLWRFHNIYTSKCIILRIFVGNRIIIISNFEKIKRTYSRQVFIKINKRHITFLQIPFIDK